MATRTRLWSVIGLSVLATAVGALLIARAARPPEAPDPANASIEQLISFAGSSQLDRLPTDGRRAYMDGLSAKYLGTDADRRAEFERASSEAGIDTSKLARQAIASMARNILDQYEQLGPEQRAEFLDQLVMLQDQIAQRTGRTEPWLEGMNLQTVLSDRKEGDLLFGHHLSLLLRHTTARERKRMAPIAAEMIGHRWDR